MGEQRLKGERGFGRAEALFWTGIGCVVVLGGGVMLADARGEASPQPCRVLSDGVVIHPTTYDLGLVSVRWKEGPLDMGREREAELTRTEAGKYIVEFPGNLPTDLDTLGAGDVAYQVITPLETYGLTTGCARITAEDANQDLLALPTGDQ